MNKTAKTLAIISMVSAFLAIFLAVVFDVIAFKDVILQFIASLILPIVAFVFLCILMLASIVFIFGILLVKEYGFWPLTLSIDFFKQLLSEIKVTQEALQTFRMFRLILIFICLCIMILAIVSKALLGRQPKEYDENGKKRKRKNGVRSMANTGLVLAILGLIVSLSAIALVGQL